MAKRRKARPFLEPGSQRPVGSSLAQVQRRKAPRRQPPPPRNNTPLLVGGTVAAVVVLAVLAYFLGWIPGFRPADGSCPHSPAPIASPGAGPFATPAATPLASPPAEPAGDGTTVTIDTACGNIVIQVFNQSSPVAAQNFTNLAEADFYNGLTFHRIVPGFVIQGGDPRGDGTGGPGYTILDEPVVGTYGRGIVAMARAPGLPNSQGSQFFIVLDDKARDDLEAYNTYAIFGMVTTGMDVVDAIAALPRDGQTPVTPVVMTEVTVQRP
jgi:peptidyl-prolyl cis-trans isomerase B (cyclophilin B)